MRCVFGVWTLRLSVNGQLLALHRFSWKDDLIVGYIRSDGEIDEAYVERMEDAASQRVSMDDLLSKHAPALRPGTLPR
ncbi:MAG: hypothetical protein U0694_15355 [Anaerolineae bacterium]